jgi:hypothetical protein
LSHGGWRGVEGIKVSTCMVVYSSLDLSFSFLNRAVVQFGPSYRSCLKVILICEAPLQALLHAPNVKSRQFQCSSTRKKRRCSHSHDFLPDATSVPGAMHRQQCWALPPGCMPQTRDYVTDAKWLQDGSYAPCRNGLAGWWGTL